MGRRGAIIFILIGIGLLVPACEALKTSKPILPLREYERMLVGRLDADYVGTKACLAACHVHDTIKRDFDASTMGAQMAQESGLPLVDCESCHGPGSLAIAGITPERVRQDAEKGIRTECRYDTLLAIEDLPSTARSLICLKCHTANATFNLHTWNAGVHAMADVSCSDCHKVHAGPDLVVNPRDTFRMCITCHQEIEALFRLPSHHQVPEERVFCTDCHNPHGTVEENLIREPTVEETCSRCHGDKEGPFVYEHADLTETCQNCHNPHGSVHDNLLNAGMPFLCLQCHVGHRQAETSPAEFKGAFYTRCTDCHSRIHGSDLPSARGAGGFTQ